MKDQHTWSREFAKGLSEDGSLYCKKCRRSYTLIVYYYGDPNCPVDENSRKELEYISGKRKMDFPFEGGE